MRRLAAALTGLVALGIAVSQLPWAYLDCRPPQCEHSESWDLANLGDVAIMLLAVVAYAGFLGLIVTGVLVATLSMGDANDATESTVRAALGETAADARRAARRRGLRDGLLAVAPAVAVAVVARPIMLASAGYPAWASPEPMVLSLIFAGALIASLVVAHGIAVARRGRTPVENLAPDVEASAPALPWRKPLRGRAIAIAVGGIGLVGLAMMVVANVVASGAVGDWPRSWVLVAGVGAYMAGGAALLLAWFVALPKLPRLAGPAMRGATAIAARLGAAQTSSVIATRASSTWRSRERALSALAGLAFLVGALGFATTQPEPTGLDLRRSLTLATFGEDSCGAECRAFEADAARVDGVDAVVPVAVLTFTRRGVERVVVLVSPGDVEDADPALAAQLRDHPYTAIWGELGPGEYGSDDYIGMKLPFREIAESQWGFGELGNRDYAESAQGTLPTNGWIVYAADGADAIAVATALTALDGAQTRDNSPVIFGATSAAIAAEQRVGSAIFLIVLCALIVAPIAAIATASVIRRRRDDATLAALGAEPGAIRASIVVEAVVTAGIALAGGLAAGVFVHVAGVAAEIAVSTSISGDGIKWGTGVPWAFHATVLALGLAAFAVTSWLASLSIRKLTPVEALRPVKEGVLS